jgi:predicted metalloendopeptidase
VEVKRGDFFGNVERAQRFESQRDLAKIGKPLDRGEWLHDAAHGERLLQRADERHQLSRGVLQPPLYDPKMDDAPNYGNTGGTIGHELTTASTTRDAVRRAGQPQGLVDAGGFEGVHRARECIADQYAQYVIVDDIKINSKLTLGEDVADVGGLILAWMAWKAETAGKTLEDRDGLTPEQRFFVGYAQWACENDRPENLRVKAVTDPHLARQVPRERPRGEHARVRARILVQAGLAHGRREALPRMVRRASGARGALAPRPRPGPRRRRRSRSCSRNRPRPTGAPSTRPTRFIWRSRRAAW